MKLSIITINFNNLEGLQKTIDSVVAQTFKDYEWIVIDGGSTDGSKEMIEQYAACFAYWVSESDNGIYNAMNKGVKVAKGEYLQFLNSGDWLYDERALERCFSHGFDSDIAFGDLFFCNGEELELYQYPEDVTLRFFYKYSLGHNASFIKRELLQLSPYDESLKIVSDWKFFLISALSNKKFENIGEIVSCFDTHGISSTNGELVVSERSKVLKELIPEMLVKDFETMDKMEQRLNLERVRKVMEYGGKKKLYRKMITGCMRIIEVLDNLSWKRGKFQS